jgi:prepilin-type N-terminal cleavage/methylation domain-containing protein
MTKRPAQRGVTLVELLVTIILAAIFFAAVVPLFVFAQKQSSGDRARVIAANIAQSKLEEARSVSYADIDNLPKTFQSTKFYGTLTVTPVGSPARYKMVTVEVSWNPPPKPVRKVVLRTAIYPQYKGPEIADLQVIGIRNLTTGPITTPPVLVKARVDQAGLPFTERVVFTAKATNGSFSTMADVPDHDPAGWFIWPWSLAGAGDGGYTFSAVAVSASGQTGEYWRLNDTLERGAPASPKLTSEGVKAGNGVVSIHWSPPSPVASDLAYYVIERTGGSSGPWTSAHLSKSSTTYIDRNNQPDSSHDVTIGTPYTYRVFAVDESGNRSGLLPEDPPNPITASPSNATNDITLPAVPANLTATALDQDITLGWDNNADADGVTLYRVYRGDDPLDPHHTSPIAVITKAANQSRYAYVDPAIGWTTAHVYLVTAVDAALNESQFASIQSPTTAPAPPVQTHDLIVKVTGSNATVMVASFFTGQVVGNDRVAAGKNGARFRSLPYSVYRVVVTFTPNTGSTVLKQQDVELVRDETITFPYP